MRKSHFRIGKQCSEIKDFITPAKAMAFAWFTHALPKGNAVVVMVL